MAYNREIFGIGKLKSTRKNEKPYYKGVIDTGYTKYSFTCYPSESGETMKVSLFKWASKMPMRRTYGYKKRF
jgi:hypothetical protein